MIRHLPRFITRNFQLKVIAVVVACGMWVGVVYASDPPAIATYTVPVQVGGVLHAGLVLLRPISPVAVKVAGVASNVKSHQVETHLSASADLSHIRKPGEYQVRLHIHKTDSNVWIWSAPTKVPVVVDRDATRSIPVHLSVSAAPPVGYTIVAGKSTISPASVTVRGPESVLANVQAEAVVNLSAVRISEPITSQVRLSNTSGLAQELTVSPTVVSVGVVVSSVVVPATVGVKVVFAGDGQPPSGYEVTGLQVQPLTVTVTGPSSVLTSLASVSTEPIDLGHATSSETVLVNLVAPAGTTLSTSVVSVIITIVPLAAPTPTPSPTPTPTP
ncbi:MAG: CdaR family protein [Candidatus Dormibacteria bacterium]